MSDAAARNTPTDEMFPLPDDEPESSEVGARTTSNAPPDEADAAHARMKLTRRRSALLGDTVIDPGALAELPAGTVLDGRFTIVGRTMRLELGSLYAARADDGRRCTLKVLERSDGSGDPGDLRLLHEARVLSILQSAYCPTLLGAGQDHERGIVWVATQAIDGVTLAEKLTSLGSSGLIDESEVWGVLDRIAEGIADLHRAGVVHCDLKPTNVLLANNTPSGVMLLDLSASVSANARASQDGIAGTPLWMAPEQARGEVITPAADVWAFGLLAFRLLAGRSYWRVAQSPIVNVRAFLREMLQEPLPSASERAEALGCAREVPEGFDAWFARCVARVPARRFQDADEMRIALRDFRRAQVRPHTLPPPAHAVAPMAPRSTPPPRATPVPRAAPTPDPWAFGTTSAAQSRRPPVVAEPIGPDSTQVRARSKPTEPSTRAKQSSPFDVSPFARPPMPSKHPGAAVSEPSSPTDETLPLVPPSTAVTRRNVGVYISVAAAVSFAVALVIYGASPDPLPEPPHTIPVTAPHAPRENVLATAPPAASMGPRLDQWPLDTRRTWTGRSAGEEGAWTFFLALRRASPSELVGHLAWTSADGVQVRESVTGEWGAEARDLVLRGVLSSAPRTRSVNAYRLRLRDDGGLSGATLDQRDTLTATLEVIAPPAPRPALAPQVPFRAATPFVRPPFVRPPMRPARAVVPSLDASPLLPTP
jgi:eukaryotic-like serine/threonine-protein kinase